MTVALRGSGRLSGPASRRLFFTLTVKLAVCQGRSRIGRGDDCGPVVLNVTGNCVFHVGAVNM